MIILFQLVLFTALVIFGVHAVTRQGKLLSFMGVYIKEEIEACNLVKNAGVDLLTLQEHFFEDLTTSMSHVEKFSLIEKYELSRAKIVNYHERYFELEEEIKRKEKRLLWKIISPFAPMLTECLTCMSSFWSILILSLYFINPIILFIFLPFAIAGLIEIIFTIAKKDFSKIVQAIEEINN